MEHTPSENTESRQPAVPEVRTEEEKARGSVKEALPRRARERSIGALFGIVIIVGLLIVGALYFWGKWIDDRAQQEANIYQNL